MCADVRVGVRGGDAAAAGAGVCRYGSVHERTVRGVLLIVGLALLEFGRDTLTLPALTPVPSRRLPSEE